MTELQIAQLAFLAGLIIGLFIGSITFEKGD